MALEDLLGKDYMDLNDYYIGGKNDDNDADVDDDDFDWVDPISDGAYSWEVRRIFRTGHQVGRRISCFEN